MGESHVTTEVAMLLLSLQVKNRWAWLALPGAGREAGNRFSPRAPRREQPATTVMPHFLRTVSG